MSVYQRFPNIPRPVLAKLAYKFKKMRRRTRYEYAKRGIKCLFFNVYDFIGHAVTLPDFDNPKYEVDRTNNDGHYAAGNIRFVPRKQNMRNRSTCHWVNYNGRK